MKIKIKNLGILRQAEFELGDLTIICGNNNTGKTYATYALFGFLRSWNRVLDLDIDPMIIDQLFREGVAHLDMLEFWENSQEILDIFCEHYSENIAEIFAAKEDRFKNTEFQIELEILREDIREEFNNSLGPTDAKHRIFAIHKAKDSFDLVITLLAETEQSQIPHQVISHFISNSIKSILFEKHLPRPFIASAERTGTAIFRKELNFARNRLLEDLGKVERERDRIELLFKGYDDYPLAIKSNVEFTRNLESIAKNDSELSQENPELLRDFSDIIGGQYTVTKNDELYFVPHKKKAKFAMDESSSAVRSLLDLGFYLRHIAKKGDLLMIDEPELNLHPENQRRIARLLAKLVNYGIKVYITTHSDYIVKEFNTLIMLNAEKSHLKKIAEEEGYHENELLNVHQIRAYIAGKYQIKLDGNSKRTRCQTFLPADIDQTLGIEIKSFDTAIDTMNRIQEAILWGGED